MKHTIINCALFAAIVATMFSIQVIDNGAEHEVAAEVAIEELVKQNRQDRFEKAAQEVCGPNAAYRLTNKQGEVICLTHRGQKTKTAQL